VEAQFDTPALFTADEKTHHTDQTEQSSGYKFMSKGKKTGLIV
jgi:hypothetical protein